MDVNIYEATAMILSVVMIIIAAILYFKYLRD